MKSLLALQAMFANLASIVFSLPMNMARTKKSRFVTKYIAGTASDLSGNTGEVLLASTKKEIGITNFENGNLLPAGKELIVTGIRVLFETTATDPKLATWTANAPACWKNGEITISQEGDGVLFHSSGTDIVNMHTATNNEEDYRDVFFKLRSEVPFSIKSALVGTATGLYKVELRCSELVEASQG